MGDIWSIYYKVYGVIRKNWGIIFQKFKENSWDIWNK